MSRLIRPAATAVALTLAGAAFSSPAVDAASGVGTAATSTSVLSVRLGADGSLLNLRVLGDDGRATTDPKVAATEAFSRLSALSLSSSVPALNRSTDPIEARSPGARPEASQSAIDLAAPASGISIPASVISGQLAPATLKSAINESAASSSLSAALTKVSAGGGLLSANSIESLLGASSSADAAEATRTIKIDAVTLVDLGSLLEGIGIKLSDLPVTTVTALLAELQTTVNGIAGAELQSSIDAMQAQVVAIEASAGGIAAGTLDTIVNELDLTGTIDTAAINSESGGDNMARANALVDALQDVLAQLLSNSLTALDAAPLVSVQDAEITVRSLARSSTADAVASVTAKVGSIRVGSVTLPGFDAGAAADQISALTTKVNGAVKEVLATVDLGLENLVSVKVLEKNTTIASEAGYTKARAGITVLSATITPPASLGVILSTLAGATGDIDEAITANGGEVPVLSTTMRSLSASLGTGVTALGQGATVKVGEVLSAADFAAATTSAPVEELPKTGGTQTFMAGLALLLGLAAYGFRRYVFADAQ